MMSSMVMLLLLAALVAALAYAEDRRNELARERIRREEADAWAEQFEREAQALAAERDRLRKQLATVQEMHAERTRQLLAQNYYIIHENIERRRQQ